MEDPELDPSWDPRPDPVGNGTGAGFAAKVPFGCCVAGGLPRRGGRKRKGDGNRLVPEGRSGAWKEGERHFSERRKAGGTQPGLFEETKGESRELRVHCTVGTSKQANRAGGGYLLVGLTAGRDGEWVSTRQGNSPVAQLNLRGCSRSWIAGCHWFFSMDNGRHTVGADINYPTQTRGIITAEFAERAEVTVTVTPTIFGNRDAGDLQARRAGPFFFLSHCHKAAGASLSHRTQTHTDAQRHTDTQTHFR